MKKSTEQEAYELLAKCLNLPENSTPEEIRDSLDRLSVKEMNYLKSALEKARSDAKEFKANLN
jgi:hypothetical protein